MKAVWRDFMRRGIMGMAGGRVLTNLGTAQGVTRRLRDRIPFMGDRLFRRRILLIMKERADRAARDPLRFQKLHEFFHTPRPGNA